MSGPDPGFLERGDVAPGKDCERQKREALGGGGGLKNVKIHVCQIYFPGN